MRSIPCLFLGSRPYTHICLTCTSLLHHSASKGLQRTFYNPLQRLRKQSVQSSFLTDSWLDDHLHAAVPYSTSRCRVATDCCTSRTHSLEEQLGWPRTGVGGTAVWTKIMIIWKVIFWVTEWLHLSIHPSSKPASSWTQGRGGLLEHQWLHQQKRKTELRDWDRWWRAAA